MRISDVKVDSSRIEAGDWVDEVPGFPDVRIKARGTGNNDYRTLRSRLIREVPAADRIGGLSDAAAERINIALLHQTILNDWEGFTEDDEKTPIKYSKSLALEWLIDPDMRAFRDAVAFAGDVVASRRKVSGEQAVKNSDGGSSGT